MCKLAHLTFCLCIQETSLKKDILCSLGSNGIDWSELQNHYFSDWSIQHFLVNYDEIGLHSEISVNE